MRGVHPAVHELPHDLVLAPHPPPVGGARSHGHGGKLGWGVAVRCQMLLEVGQSLLAAVLVQEQSHHLPPFHRFQLFTTFVSDHMSTAMVTLDAQSTLSEGSGCDVCIGTIDIH